MRPFVAATLWMGGTLVSLAAMAIGGRELAGSIGTFEIVFLRSLVAFAVVSAVLTRSGWHQISLRNFRLHAVRNVIHFGGQCGWFFGLGLIPLAEVTAIEFTTPAWTMLLAAVILGERLTGPRMLAVGLGIAGMLTILRPGLAIVSPGALAVVGAALCFALSNVLTKRLTTREESPLAIVFYMPLIQAPIGLLPALQGWVTPALQDWPWLIVVGVTALTAHYCISRAMKLAEATVVAPMDFLRLPLIALAGFVFYGETLDGYVIAGALMMVAGNLANVLAERPERRLP